MRLIRKALMVIAAIGMFAVVIQGCKKDKGPEALNIVSMKVGDADLNGAESPGDVAVNASIVIEFNTEIKSGSATTDNISLTQDYNSTDIPVDITVDGPVVTITPKSALGFGILYKLAMSGLVNVDEQQIGQVERTFTTTGTFSPPGMIANWTFEDSPDDVVGDYNAASDGVVDVTYVDSRNAAAGKAAQFNGNTSIIEIPNADPLVNTEDFTINFWVKANSDHLNADGNPAGHWVMGLGAHMGIQFEIFGGYDGAKFAISYELADGSTASEDMWFPAEATDNTNGGWQGWDYARSLTPTEMEGYLKDSWLHVTYTYDGSEKKAKLFYNGEIMKSFDFDLWPDDAPKQTAVGMMYGGSEPDVVNELAFGFIQSRAGTMWDDQPWGGYGYTGSNHFKGLLDDVKIYHKVLTETEVQLMYDSEK